jgi:hypothetical protein
MSLTIHTMSGLYSRVITETINPGFTMAVQTSHYVSGETSVVLAQKEQTRILYLEDAERKCKASNQAVSRDYVWCSPSAMLTLSSGDSNAASSHSGD